MEQCLRAGLQRFPPDELQTGVSERLAVEQREIPIAIINTHAVVEMATGEIDFSKPKNKKPAQVSLSGLL